MKAADYYPQHTELRRVPINFEVRKAGTHISSSPGTLVGYAVKFNSMSEDLGFREMIAPNAFQRSLANGDDIRALVNHNPDKIVGRTKNGTLRLNEDNVGLNFEVDVAPTSYGRDLVASVKRGDLSNCSFAFTVSDEDWSKTNDPDSHEEVPLRVIRAASLLDVSVVTFAAYSSSEVSARDDEFLDDPFNNANPFDDSEDDDEGDDELNSLRNLFPVGVPVEVRSHVPNLHHVIRRSSPSAIERRRNLLRAILL